MVGEHFTPDITFNFLGIKLSMPIIGSSVAGPGKYNNCISEIDFWNANVDGCREAGSIAFRGDTYFYTVNNHPSLDSIHSANGFGIPIFKPRSQESLKKLIKKAEMMGCPAVGIDLDGCGSTNMASAGQPVYRKSLQDMKDLVNSTNLPFIFKGVMNVSDAELCLEAGAKVISVSNHGGRVMDYTPGVAEVLPKISKTIGDKAIITADGGIRTGYDVLKMLALGADAVLIGRDLVRASIGGGIDGVKMQMEYLAKTLKHAMFMTGCTNLKSIDSQIFYD